jgi:hypothetical protein
MPQPGGHPAPARFRLRVLTSKLSRRFTSAKDSPTVGPRKPKVVAPPVAPPDGDCDGDGVVNSVDNDDDNDLLSDATEKTLGTDPCKGDTDGDGVEDGYEWQSAIDLNNDDYQNVNTILPYPGKRPYPNPLFKDGDVDYDGDGLSLGTEYDLWKYTYTVNHTATRTLSPLSYSDGAQYSLSHLQNGTGVRVPDMPVTSYSPPQTFANWASVSGYGAIYDFDHDGTVRTDPLDAWNNAGQLLAEKYYWNLDGDNFVSDDERDEDGDGLTNYDEFGGRMQPGYWAGCYSGEAPYPIAYAGTSPVDADSDGDGILDGADDQDHDDVPNIAELSRNMAAGSVHPPQWGSTDCKAATNATAYADFDGNGDPIYQGRVNPFNPCLPNPYSRTCERHPNMNGTAYPPFDDNGIKYFVLN